MISNESKLQNVSNRTEKAILQAALEEFAECGFAGGTTRGIASRAGLSHGAIRYHYETKEKLWFAAVDFLFERLNREVALSPIDHARMVSGNVDVFRNWLRRYVFYCAKHPEHARIIFQESLTGSGRLKMVVERYSKAGHVVGLEVIKSLKEKKVFPEHASPVSILYIITGAAQNIFALAEECKLSLNHDPLTNTAIAAHADVVVNMICPLE